MQFNTQTPHVRPGDREPATTLAAESFSRRREELGFPLSAFRFRPGLEP